MSGNIRPMLVYLLTMWEGSLEKSKSMNDEEGIKMFQEEVDALKKVTDVESLVGWLIRGHTVTDVMFMIADMSGKMTSEELSEIVDEVSNRESEFPT